MLAPKLTDTEVSHHSTNLEGVINGFSLLIEDEFGGKGFSSLLMIDIMKTLLLIFLLGFTSVVCAADASVVNPHGSSLHGAITNLADIGDVNVSKAVGQNAYTVAEVIDQSKSLKDKQVLIRAKVVKISPDIMKKNWLHLRDGSGSIVAKNNDLVVTTKEQAAVGSVITIKGVLRTDKDFGYGYRYEVLVEDASIGPK